MRVQFSFNWFNSFSNNQTRSQRASRARAESLRANYYQNCELSSKSAHFLKYGPYYMGFFPYGKNIPIWFKMKLYIIQAEILDSSIMNKSQNGLLRVNES